MALAETPRALARRVMLCDRNGILSAEQNSRALEEESKPTLSLRESPNRASCPKCWPVEEGVIKVRASYSLSNVKRTCTKPMMCGHRALTNNFRAALVG
jgi:hypothetical protein